MATVVPPLALGHLLCSPAAELGCFLPLGLSAWLSHSQGSPRRRFARSHGGSGSRGTSAVARSGGRLPSRAPATARLQDWGRLAGSLPTMELLCPRWGKRTSSSTPPQREAHGPTARVSNGKGLCDWTPGCCCGPGWRPSLSRLPRWVRGRPAEPSYSGTPPRRLLSPSPRGPSIPNSLSPLFLHRSLNAAHAAGPWDSLRWPTLPFSNVFCPVGPRLRPR